MGLFKAFETLDCLKRSMFRRKGKNMKKYVSVFLCIVFIFICVSCAAPEEIVPEYDDSTMTATVDLKGQTLIMGIVQDYFLKAQIQR